MDTILVLDCGAQYGHLIARAIRRLGVYSEIVPADSVQHLPENIKGVIISGGPSSVYDDTSPKPPLFDMPTLGICYGHQYIAYRSGGNVQRSERKEYGPSVAMITIDSPLTKGLKKYENVWMSHADSVVSLPEGFDIYASTDNCPIAAYGNAEKGLYGLQFHPEVAHTESGETLLSNFIHLICEIEPNWSVRNYAASAIDEIKNTVGNSRAIIALSGGIDSATAALLASKAIGNQLHAVYVDTGLMRYGETDEIRSALESYLNTNLSVIDAEKIFLESLRGISDPEKKRGVIGDLFARLFNEAIIDTGSRYLIQGTIYPDRIESAQPSTNASKIKTHHNVGAPLIENMREEGHVVEPLKDLYKDEVREIALQLEMPVSVVYRQPFPGPGMAVRIEGSITRKKLSIVREADRIVSEEVEKAYTLEERPWQYFAVLTRSRRTGVKGDRNIYGNVVIVRAVNSRDAMTASVFHLDPDVQEKIAARMPNEIPEITGVAYEVTNKPPATIEWE